MIQGCTAFLQPNTASEELIRTMARRCRGFSWPSSNLCYGSTSSSSSKMVGRQYQVSYTR